MPLQSKILTRFFESCQKKVEAANFSIRKNVLEYDEVLNRQRQIIYGERDKVLDGVDIHPQIIEMLKEYVFEICRLYLDEGKPSYEWDIVELNKALEDKLVKKGTNIVTADMLEDTDVNSASQIIFDKLSDIYEKKVTEVKKIGFDFSIVERDILLRAVDRYWTDHIDAMNTLRNEIGVLAYGQKDPIVAYKNQGFEMFDKMISDIREYTASYLFRVDIRINIAPLERRGPVLAGNTNKSESGGVKRSNSSHIGRNDLCPCGSGKKYKNCCMNKEK